MMKRPLLWACLCTLLCVDAVVAQGFGAAPRGMPMLPPVAGTNGQSMPTSGTPASMPADCGSSQPGDPVTTGPQVVGKDLARAIRTVTALQWFDDLGEARLEAAATGKPILWLQGLGDIDGFA
jgi:hypothetical protein